MSRHFCYEGDPCTECSYTSVVKTALKPVCTCPLIDVTTYGKAPGSETVKGYSPTCPACPRRYATGGMVKAAKPVDVSWVTLIEIPAPIVWPWWLAVPAAALKRWLIRLWLP